ncbi:MAG: hypothetical protein KJO44_01810 [Gemmatimonadetes bacterium]|nr:hypothetical protein [Gemmatimonadota bacterium]MBT8477935.1 hypothetical protein [Gemmatimonadota bacterium]NNK49346.1 hypothetical protein [Gemmatimonadota bacterium]
MAYTRDPKTPEEMLQNAAEIERATHHVALYIDAPDDRVREHPGPALVAALSIIPERQPLRRGKDQAIIYALRVLARELPDTHPRKNDILKRLSAASRRAVSGRGQSGDRPD